MALKGYSRQPGRCKGGIIRMAVIRSDDVLGVEFDRASGNATAIELSEGKSFALYNFKEDTAVLVERTEINAGFIRTRAELSLALERLDEKERSSMSELLERSSRGYVIITVNGCGTAHLLGYSRRLGSRFPVRVKSTEASSRLAPHEPPIETVTFYGDDVEKIPVYTGNLPAGL